VTIWLPTRLGSSHLLGYYRGSSLTALADTAPIDQWNDESGNARHATQTGSNRPTYSAANQAASFADASDQFFNVAGLSASQLDRTIVAVVTLSTTGVNTLLGASGNGGLAFRVPGNAAKDVLGAGGGRTPPLLPAIRSTRRSGGDGTWEWLGTARPTGLGAIPGALDRHLRSGARERGRWGAATERTRRSVRERAQRSWAAAMG
jgi:hypothetical protein